MMQKALALLLIFTSTMFAQVKNSSDEIRYEIPVVIQNFSIQYDTENTETYPGFLTKRGDFKKIKRVTGNGKGIKVGVVDTGVDETHRRGDLAGVVEAKDFTRSRSGWRDLAGHGSHVAGMIGAKADGKGIEGIASDCDLYIAKGLGDRGFGSESEIANAIDWLIEKDVDIINLSLGGGYSQRIENAIIRADKAGILVFAALGNDGPNGRAGHPGNSRYTLGIAALDYNLQLARFSSRSNVADLSGYGVDVFSCVSGGRYAAYSGTSMATPDQAGLAALVLGHQRALGNDLSSSAKYLAFIKKYIKDLGPQGRDTGYGFGFFDIQKYVADYQDKPSPEDPFDPNPEEPEDPETPENPGENPFKNYEIIGRLVLEGEEFVLLKKRK